MATGRVNIGGTPFYNKINNLQSGTKVELININQDFDFLTAIPNNIYKDETIYYQDVSSETKIDTLDSNTNNWEIFINGSKYVLSESKYPYRYWICPVFLYLEKKDSKLKIKFLYTKYSLSGGSGSPSGGSEYFEKEIDYTKNINIYITVPYANLKSSNDLRIVAWKN